MATWAQIDQELENSSATLLLRELVLNLHQEVQEYADAVHEWAEAEEERGLITSDCCDPCRAVESGLSRLRDLHQRAVFAGEQDEVN